MAAFLVRAFELPQAQEAAGFEDVLADHWAVGYVDSIAASGITVGCSVGPPLYCGERSTTRAQMATFVHRAVTLVEEPDQPDESEQSEEGDGGGGGGGGGGGSGGSSGGGGGAPVAGVTTMGFAGGGRRAVEGGSAAVVEVVLSRGLDRPVSVGVAVVHGGGADSADYAGVPSSVFFGVGETRASFEVSAVDDGVDDDGESVTVRLVGLPVGVAAGSVSAVTVALVDDDDPQVGVSFGELSRFAHEGGAAAGVEVVLSADPERIVVVELSATPVGGATAADFWLSSTLVTFRAGQTAARVRVVAVDDGDDDDGEGVVLGFAALPDGVAAVAPFEATVSIADDDTALKAVTARFSASSYAAAEGGAAAGVEVVLSADPERAVVVDLFATPQGGATGADFGLSSARAVFAAGQTVARVEVSAVDDGDDDDGESVAVGFAALPDGVAAALPFEATVSIIDNDDHDPAPPQSLRVEGRSDPARNVLGAVVWAVWEPPAAGSAVAGYVLEWRADGDDYSTGRRLRLPAAWGAAPSHWLRVATVGGGGGQSDWAEIGPVAMVAPAYFAVRERWERELEFSVVGEPRHNAELITGYRADIRTAATDAEPAPGPWTAMEVTAFSTPAGGGRTQYRAHAGGLDFGVPYEVRAAPLTAAGDGAFEIRGYGVLRMPCPPTNVRATGVARGVEASWDPPVCTGSFEPAGYYTGLAARFWLSRFGVQPTAATTASQAFNRGGGYVTNLAVAAADVEGNLSRVVMSPYVEVLAQPPGAVGGLTATTDGEGRLAVTWQEPADHGRTPVRYYRITWAAQAAGHSHSDGAHEGALYRDLADLSYVIGGLVNGAAYDVTVEAVSWVGAGPGSTVTATPQGAAPGAAHSLVAFPDEASITVAWQLPDNEAHRAEVQYKTTTQTWEQASTEAAHHRAGPHTIDTDPGAAYDIRVVTTNRLGTATSGSVTATATAAPDAPRSLNLTCAYDVTQDAMRVSWQPPAEADTLNITKYRVQWRTADDTFDDTRSVDITTANTRRRSCEQRYVAAITGLANETLYHVRVTAHNTNGELSAAHRAIPTRLIYHHLRAIADTYSDTYPWLGEVLDDPAVIHVTSPDPVDPVGTDSVALHSDGWGPTGTWGGKLRWLARLGSNLRSEFTIHHELAHVYTQSLGSSFGDPAAVAAGWLYTSRLLNRDPHLPRPWCDTVSEIYADLLSLAGARHYIYPTSYYRGCGIISGWLTSEDVEVAESVLAGEVPQWFDDTYSTDGGTSYDLDAIWNDIRQTGVSGRGEIARGLSAMFGGDCSRLESAYSLRWPDPDRPAAAMPSKNAWADGGCDSRRPLDLELVSGDGAIRATWLPPRFRPTGGYYLVQWKAQGQHYSRAREVTTRGRSAELHGLTPGVSHTVRVLQQEYGDQPYSLTDRDGHERFVEATVVVVDTPLAPPDAPGPPSEASVEPEDTALRVTWEPPQRHGAGVSGYRVQWRADSQAFSLQERSAEVSANAWVHRIEGLVNGTEHHVQVVALSESGDSAAAAVSATPRGRATAPCTTASWQNGDLTVSWQTPDDDGGSDITGYQIDVLLIAGLGEFWYFPTSRTLPEGADFQRDQLGAPVNLRVDDFVALAMTVDAGAASATFEDIDDELDALAAAVGDVKTWWIGGFEDDWFPLRHAHIAARALTSAGTGNKGYIDISELESLDEPDRSILITAQSRNCADS